MDKVLIELAERTPTMAIVGSIMDYAEVYILQPTEDNYNMLLSATATLQIKDALRFRTVEEVKSDTAFVKESFEAVGGLKGFTEGGEQ